MEEALHAILSPSSAHRFLICTPSARFEEQIPEEESDYATEGTLAHELAALLLSARAGIFKGDQTAFNKILKALEVEVGEYYKKVDKPNEFKEMYDYCDDYAGFIADKGGEIHIERKYDLTKYLPLSFGTADATNVVGKVLHVSDFKYGAGVRVMATANKQLMCYALGALEAFKDRKIETIATTIYQPRAGGVSTWDISAKDLFAWAEEIKPLGKLAIAGMGDFVAGDHCQFCKARTSCKAYYDRYAEVRKLKDKRVMTDKEIADVLNFGGLVGTWAKKVEEDVVKRLQANTPLEGFKLVAGRGRRSFRSEDDVVDILIGEGYESDDIFNPALNSLTAIEKMVGPKKFKEIFADQIINLEGKPQIAPIDDDRPAIGVSAADEYDE